MATPIGNLQDITLRALETLKGVDLILAEDSRVTAKLLNHYNISKKIISYHQHSKLVKIELIVTEAKAGKSIALVTDAGTPGISDPGNELVARLVAEGVRIIPIPGASALSSIISVAGIDLQKFVFLGFPPHKKGRETFFKKISVLEYPAIYYDSPYRVVKNLELAEKIVPNKKVIIGRELTKLFEEIRRGSLREAINYFTENKDKVKGEFVVILF